MGQLRRLVGKRKVLAPSVVGLIQNGLGEVLLIQRRDNRRWGLPAGTLELQDSVYEGMVREVKEETGLDVVSATLIAIHSGPRFATSDAFGGQYQPISFVFRIDKSEGSLVTETDETVDARFVNTNALPQLSVSARQAIEDLGNFSGQVMY